MASIELKGGDRLLIGIYLITIMRSGKPRAFYIGQSIDISEREKCHLRALRAGRHDNKYMQNLYNKHGEASVSFSIVCECADSELTDFEQAILDEYIVQYGSSRVVNVMRECVKSHAGVKRSAETRRKMSEAQKGRKKTPEQVAAMAARQLGFRHSTETKDRMSKNMRGMNPHPNSLAALERGRNNPKRLAAISAGKLRSSYFHSDETKAKISATLKRRSNGID